MSEQPADAQTKPKKIQSPVLVALLAAMVSGPVGGAFVWWLNKEVDTKLVYSQSATLRHDVNGVSDLVPGLALTIHGEPAAIIYREVKVWPESGPSVDLKIAFSLSDTDTEVWAATEVASGLFSFECERSGSELLCDAKNLNPAQPEDFVLRVASEVEQPLIPKVAHSGVVLEKAGNPTSGTPTWFYALGFYMMLNGLAWLMYGRLVRKRQVLDPLLVFMADQYRKPKDPVAVQMVEPKAEPGASVRAAQEPIGKP